MSNSKDISVDDENQWMIDDSNIDNDGYSGGDRESSDYDAVDNPDYFNDEQNSSNRDLGAYDDSQKFKDDGGTRMEISDEWWEGREKLIAIVAVCWCCLCFIIIGVVVGILVGGKNKTRGPGATPRPTLHPTLAPQPLPPSLISIKPTERVTQLTLTDSPTLEPTLFPTISPTVSPAPTISIPETLGVIANQDTFVILNGHHDIMGEEHGKMDTFVVQNGPVKDETVPDTVALITFPFDAVPAFSRLTNLPVSAALRLYHVVPEESRGTATYTIVRIPETRMAIEYFHGFSFRPPEDDADGVLVGPSFTVKPDDEVVDIDVTEVLFEYEFEPEEEPNQMMLMIQNRGPEQLEGGDVFYSRESNTPPELLIDFVGGDPSDITIVNLPGR